MLSSADCWKSARASPVSPRRCANSKPRPRSSASPRRARMTRRCALLLAAALPLIQPEFAQEGKVWRIGVLETTPRAMNTVNLDALRKGLQELGYAEGRNLIIHYRSADGNPGRFPELAKELVLEK